MSAPTPPLPEVGWPITLVFSTGVVTHTVVVDGLATRSCFLVCTAKAEQNLQLNIADEAIGWIRGHHLIDSEPVRAALAAQALLPKREETADDTRARLVEKMMRAREEAERIAHLNRCKNPEMRWPSVLGRRR